MFALTLGTMWTFMPSNGTPAGSRIELLQPPLPLHGVTMTDNPLVDLLDEVIRTRTRLQSLFAEATTAASLSAMQSLVLTSVIESKTPPTVPKIGRSLGYPRQTVQRATNALLESGLLETAENPDHKRAHLLVVTPAGKQAYELSRKSAAKAERDVLAVVDAAECERVANDLKQIRGKIERHLRARKDAGE